MVICSAYGCSNKPDIKIPGLTYHRFPRNVQNKTKWIVAMRRANWHPTKNSVLCSEHFEPHMFIKYSKMTRLKGAAVPTIFRDYRLSSDQITNSLQVMYSAPVKEEPDSEDEDIFLRSLPDIQPKKQIIAYSGDRGLQENYLDPYNNTASSNIVVVSDAKDPKNALEERYNDDDRTIIVSDGRIGDGEVVDDIGLKSLMDQIARDLDVDAQPDRPNKFYVERLKELGKVKCELQKKVRAMKAVYNRKRNKIKRLEGQLDRWRRIGKLRCFTTKPVIHMIAEDMFPQGLQYEDLS